MESRGSSSAAILHLEARDGGIANAPELVAMANLGEYGLLLEFIGNQGHLAFDSRPMSSDFD
jgi:hypothetical protein